MSKFDHELIEYTDAMAGLGGDLAVYVYKVGGGSVGRSYDGFWGYRVTRGEQVCGEGEDFATGTPHTHADVAAMVAEFFDTPDYAVGLDK